MRAPLFFLVEKEFKQMFRNIILPIVFVVLPMALMNMLPRLATQEIKNLSFTIVDHDNTTSSRRLTEQIAASTYFTLVESRSSYDEALADIESGAADFIVLIDRNFEKNLITGQRPNVQISANGVNGVKAGLGSSYIMQIIQVYLQNFSSESGSYISSPNYVGNRGGAVMPSVHAVFNPTLDYKIYMVPAVIAMLIVLLVGFLPALNIVGEKEKGTIEQINVTPVGRVTFIFSKLIPYWIVGLFLITTSMLAARALYGIVPAGSIPAIYLVSTVFILVMSSLGLIVSNYSSTLRQAALLMFFFLVICILMSGLLTPIASMPEWAQVITRFNPFRYIISALRILYIRPSSGLSQISFDLAHLAAFAIIFAIWAIRSYKKRE